MQLRVDHLAFDVRQEVYDEFFFPTLVEKGITTVMHLGDVFDRRKYINYNTLKSCKQYFFDKAQELGLDLHHDPRQPRHLFSKNTNEVDSHFGIVLLQDYDNVIIFTRDHGSVN